MIRGQLSLIILWLCVTYHQRQVGAGRIAPPEAEDNLSGEKSAKNGTLQLVHVLFRHGPRTPVDTYPNDPYVNETFYPYGWGHLTNDAKMELYKIGSGLAERYGKLLGPYYKDEILYAESSTSPRTLMSMSLVLAGLMPPENTAMEWNFKLNWQPIPTYSKPRATDTVLGMRAPCPRYDQAMQEVLHLPEVQQQLATYRKLMQELSEITGLNITTAADMSSLFITLMAEQAYGLELPPWTSAYYPHAMLPLAEQSYIQNSYTIEMQRLKGGQFLQKILRQMQLKTEGKLTPKDRKMFLMCGHDWTITNVLIALKVWKPKMPQFSALVSFELYQNEDSKEYYVQIYFQNGPKQELIPLVIPGCGFQCPLNDLLHLTAEVMPTGTYDEMCRIK